MVTLRRTVEAAQTWLFYDGDAESLDELVRWCLDRFMGRFQAFVVNTDGRQFSKAIAFESRDDAMLCKLTW